MPSSEKVSIIADAPPAAPRFSMLPKLFMDTASALGVRLERGLERRRSQPLRNLIMLVLRTALRVGMAHALVWLQCAGRVASADTGPTARRSSKEAARTGER